MSRNIFLSMLVMKYMSHIRAYKRSFLDNQSKAFVIISDMNRQPEMAWFKWYMDYSKAFYKVNQLILESKLKIMCFSNL